MSVVGEWSTGDLVWFDPGVGHWLPGEVLENHRSANVLTVQAVINGKVIRNYKTIHTLIRPLSHL